MSSIAEFCAGLIPQDNFTLIFCIVILVTILWSWDVMYQRKNAAMLAASVAMAISLVVARIATAANTPEIMIVSLFVGALLCLLSPYRASVIIGVLYVLRDLIFVAGTLTDQVPRLMWEMSHWFLLFQLIALWFGSHTDGWGRVGRLDNYLNSTGLGRYLSAVVLQKEVRGGHQ